MTLTASIVRVEQTDPLSNNPSSGKFQIVIRPDIFTAFPSLAASTAASVWRSYSEFVELNQTLARNSLIEIPLLPKALCTSDTLEAGLRHYLAQFAHSDLIPPLTRTFLGIPPPSTRHKHNPTISPFASIMDLTKAEQQQDEEEQVALKNEHVNVVALREVMRMLQKVQMILSRLRVRVKSFGQALVMSSTISLIVQWRTKRTRIATPDSFGMAPSLLQSLAASPLLLLWCFGASGVSVLLATTMISNALMKVNKLLKETENSLAKATPNAIGLMLQTGRGSVPSSLQKDANALVSLINFRTPVHNTEHTQLKRIAFNAANSINVPDTDGTENASFSEQPDDYSSSPPVADLMADMVTQGKFDELYELAESVLDSYRSGNGSDVAIDDEKLMCYIGIAFRYKSVQTRGNGSDENNNKEKANELLNQALTHLERAIEIDESNALCHKWMAIVSEERSRGNGTRAQIEGGIKFYEHTSRALELAPNDPTLHFMFGKFQYEVAMLSWIQRNLARGIFGSEPPTATVQESLLSFENAARLRPIGAQSPCDYLEIGRGQIYLGNKVEARAALERCFELPPLSCDEKYAHGEARELLKKL